METRRDVMAGIGAGIAVASTIGFAAFAQAAPFKIGALISGADHDGNDQMIAPYDAQMRLGLELAIAEVNAGGGVLGRPMELLVRNDFGSPAPAAEEVVKFLEVDGCEAIISGFVLATRGFLNRTLKDRPTTVPVIHGFGTEGTLCSDFIFHTGPTSAQSLQPMVQHLGEAACDMAFTVSEWTPSQRVISNQLQTTIHPPLIGLAGAALVTTPIKGYKPGEYHNLARWMHDFGSKIDYVTVPRPYAVNVINQAIDAGVGEGKIFAYLDFSEAQAAELVSGAEVLTCLPMVAADPDPKVQAFVGAARKLSGGTLATHVAYTHYNAVMALRQAMEAAGEPTGAAAPTG